MIYTSQCAVSADTKTNKLVLILADGKRFALTFGSKRQLGVDVVKDDRPAGHFEDPKQLIRYLVQNLYTPEQVEMALEPK